ncbi:glycosyltransferase family 2 protein [Chrysiogenes arsenatis]|uniref:glycosyltransferase family 2 protein n=1 Tax=Chrysiogenes arsenatis TaxID=309797 RepID=UPI0004049D19|nr:glycosyltransferase [Chrysiogenes arsenatis]
MSEHAPLVSVILDNYNYADYLPEAIESVLQQTYPHFELIVVDDGSTDASRDVINTYAERDHRIRPVFKLNGGQASAFNAGYAASNGDIICFLDSDDLFMPNKLAKLVECHEAGNSFVHTDHQSIDTQGSPCTDTIKRYRYDGYNLFLVYYLSKYPGNVTSTLSLTRALAEKIFPLPHEQDWRIQADDAIVFQAAMMTRSTFFDQKLTRYRIHHANGHYGKKNSHDYLYELLKKRNTLKDIAMQKISTGRTFLGNSYNLAWEFSTHRTIDLNLVQLYMKVLWFEMEQPFLKKMETSLSLWNFYRKQTMVKRAKNT